MKDLHFLQFRWKSRSINFGDPYVRNPKSWNSMYNNTNSPIMCSHMFQYHVIDISEIFRMYIYIYRYTIYTFVPLKERKTFRKDNQIILEFLKTPQLDSLHFSATVRMFALSAWYRRGLSFDPRSLRVRFQECFFLFFTSCPGPK